MSEEQGRPPAIPPQPGAAPPPSAPPPPLPAPRVMRRRDWVPSLIWLIPIVAALVGLTLVAKLLTDRGPEITLLFQSAEGLEAGKTAVRYKDVQIGVVQAINLSQDRASVRVKVQLTKEASGFTAADTRYWVVRPRLDISGISGLGTLLSGAYIGADAGASEDTAHVFTGLEVPPVVTRDISGREYLLRARDIGSLDIGSPVFFRHIKVGQIASYQLDGDGRGVSLRVFVATPYEKFVGLNTRFWHASGLDVQLGAAGVTLRTQSLATILLGGVAFQAPDDESGPVAPDNATFTLADDQASAMKPPDGPATALLLNFNQSLRGLGPGSPVDFRGVVIGEVKSIGVEFDRNGREFRMPVLVQVYPDRLRRQETELDRQSHTTQRERLQLLIAKGLRAQLRTGNLLTGQNYVALDFFPKEKAVRVDIEKNPIMLPTVPNGLDEIQTQVQEIAAKVNKIPFEQLAADVRRSLATLDRTLASAERMASGIDRDVTPQIAATLADARKTLDSAGRTLAEDAPLQQDLRQTLQELTRTAGSIRVLTDYLERHPESLLRGKPDDHKQ